MNGCECKDQGTAAGVSAKKKAATKGLTDLLEILGALGQDVRVLDATPNTMELENFINNGEEFPEGISYVVLEREDFGKLWERSRSIVRSEIKAKHFAPKVPAYSEKEALHTVFSAARKAKMDAFIAQHGQYVFNTYDAWQKLGFQVRQGEIGQTVGVLGASSVRVFGLSQTVAVVKAVPVWDVVQAIVKFCDSNNIGTTASMQEYPWTDRYFDLSFRRSNVRETGEFL